MKYPKLVSWMKVRRTSEGEYVLVDMVEDKEYELSKEEAYIAVNLNGKTDPSTLKIPSGNVKRNEFIDALISNKHAKKHRWMSLGLSQKILTLWEPKVSEGLVILSELMNSLLLISWLPLLIAGICFFVRNDPDFYTDEVWVGIALGTALGLFLGMAVHEAGHMFACLSYGGNMYEAGLLLCYFILPGAYVIIDDKPVRSRLKKLQIYAAGVEMNFALAGFALIVSAYTEGVVSLIVLGITSTNIILGCMNFIMVGSMDGMRMFSALFGSDNVLVNAIDVITSRRRRQKLKKSGVSGTATVLMCGIICATQIALPLLLIVNVLGVISCF